MIITEPSFKIRGKLGSAVAWHEVLKKLESIGRVCYQSESKDNSVTGAYDFVRMLIRRGHESVIEHASMTVAFICDRGVSHELVRHRVASFSQESTRYCRYKNDLYFIKPPNLHGATYLVWLEACQTAENSYLNLLAKGETPQIARSVLPNSLKTQIVMTANMREWRHVFKLRCSPAAHPQMRELMIPLRNECRILCPALFDDLE